MATQFHNTMFVFKLCTNMVLFLRTTYINSHDLFPSFGVPLDNEMEALQGKNGGNHN